MEMKNVARCSKYIHTSTNLEMKQDRVEEIGFGFRF